MMKAKRKGVMYVQFICLCLAAFLTTAFPAGVLATDYYVMAAGNDGNSGLDWDNAKATIGAALTLADGNDNIRVAAGTYAGPITFPSANSIQLLGGVSGRRRRYCRPLDKHDHYSGGRAGGFDTL